jgi:hypothetical protein
LCKGDHFLVRRPDALDQCQVGLAGLALTELVLQPGQRGALLGQQQDAGRLPVQSVHQFEEFRLGTGLPQLFDHAETHPAAAMHRNPGRLVDDQQRLVLHHHHEIARRYRGHSRGRRQTNRRHAYDIADAETEVGADATLVNADFATAQNPIHVTLRHPFANTQEKVVDPLSLALLADLQRSRRFFAQALHLQYTALGFAVPRPVCPTIRSGVGGIPGLC